jgi:hypothetical protein
MPGCVPDILRRVVETAVHASDDTWFQTRVLKQAMTALADADFDRSAAELTFDAISVTGKLVGKGDPFEKAKQNANAAMLSLLPDQRKLAGQVSDDPVAGAIRLAAAAAAVGFPEVGEIPALRRQLRELVSRPPAIDDVQLLREALKGAKKVLYVLDRAGEIVADRVLVEALSGKEVTCVVRRSPILGCATNADAVAVGIDALAKVVDPGADMLGLVQNLASKRFNETLVGADVVVAKGPDNFQTLAGAEREVFFLLAPVSRADAEYLRVEPGASVVCHHEPPAVPARRKAEG